MQKFVKAVAIVAGFVLISACGATSGSSVTTVVPIGPTAFATIPPVQPTTPVPVTTLPDNAVGEEQTYMVKSGDAPLRVAALYGISLADLIAYNGWVSASEFPLPGTEIKIPPNATKPGSSTPGSSAPANSSCGTRPAGSYVVASGDSLNRIANKFCVKMATLLAANGWADTSQTIYPGMTINIPAAGT